MYLNKAFANPELLWMETKSNFFANNKSQVLYYIMQMSNEVAAHGSSYWCKVSKCINLIVNYCYFQPLPLRLFI